MSYWNHRIVKHKTDYPNEFYYAIHEVYYNDDGSIWAITENPVKPFGNSLEELKEILQRMLDCTDKEVLDEDLEFVDKK